MADAEFPGALGELVGEPGQVALFTAATALRGEAAHPVDGVRELLEVITSELEVDAPLLRVIIEQVPHAGGPTTSARSNAAWPSWGR